MHYFALGLKAVYDQVIKVPKFLLMIGTGLLGSLVMRLMHWAPAKTDEPKDKPAPKRKAPAPETAAVPTPPATPKKTPGKGKKGGKK